MAVIKIDIGSVESSLKSINLTKKTVITIKENFSSTSNKIDYNIRQQIGSSGVSIGATISTINNKLNSIDSKLKNIEEVISFATNKYTEVENKVIKNSKLSEININKLTNPQIKDEKKYINNSEKINDKKYKDANIDESNYEKNIALNKITSFFEDGFKGFVNDLKESLVDISTNIYTDGADEFVEWARAEDFKTLLDLNPNSDRVLIGSEFINDIDNMGKFSGEFFKNFGFFKTGLDYGGLIVNSLENQQGVLNLNTVSEIVVETIPFVLKFTGGAILGLCGVTFGLSGIAAICATAVSAFALTWVSGKIVDSIFKEELKDYLKSDFEQTITSAFAGIENCIDTVGNAVRAT